MPFSVNFMGFFVKIECVLASKPARPKQALWTPAKPDQVKPAKSSIAYRCIAKQTKQQSKSSKQSKARKQSTAKQTKGKQATKPTKPNQSKTSKQTKKKHKPSQLKPNQGK